MERSDRHGLVVVLCEMTTYRFAYSLVFGLMAVAAVACGNSDSVAAPETAVSTATHEAATSAANTPAPTIASQEQEAVDIMWRLIGRYGAADENAVKAAGRNGHPGLVPVLVEAASRTFNPDLALEISRALESITGDSVGGDFVLSGPWFSWMGRQNPPQVMLPEFDEWKGEILATIDPSFKEFIYEDVPTRIPLWTVAWGGSGWNSTPGVSRHHSGERG